jgi:hypothetical protein
MTHEKDWKRDSDILARLASLLAEAVSVFFLLSSDPLTMPYHAMQYRKKIERKTTRRYDWYLATWVRKCYMWTCMTCMRYTMNCSIAPVQHHFWQVQTRSWWPAESASRGTIQSDTSETVCQHYNNIVQNYGVSSLSIYLSRGLGACAMRF